MNNQRLIIAEIGVNHNGDIELAKQQIKLAKESGADVVKFQTYITEELVTKSAVKADYQKVYEKNLNDQFSMLKKFELSYEDFEDLSQFSKRIGIEFLSTAFDLKSLSFLKSLGMKRIKVPSGEVDNLPFLSQLPSFKLPIILSTGMSNIYEVQEAISILVKGGVSPQDITVLHCTSEYPAPLDTINLKVIGSLKEVLNLEIGYSDHSQGLLVPTVAYTMGIRVIEKHFTSSKELPGPDQKASLDPKEFRQMINTFDEIDKLLGSADKKPSKIEEKNKKNIRRSIVAKVAIKKSEILTEDNLTLKRPGDGIPASKWYEVLGKHASKDFMIDEQIKLDNA